MPMLTLAFCISAVVVVCVAIKLLEGTRGGGFE
jgi:hypothetical protein